MKRFALTVLTVTLTASMLAGCGRSSNVQTATSTSAPSVRHDTVLVTAGTTYRGKLQNEINSKTSHDGDKFSIDNKGETIYGHLENVHAAGMGKKPAMTLVFDNVTMPDGSVAAPIDVKIENMGAFDAKSHHLRTIGMMIAAGTAGHMAAGKHHGGTAGATGAYILSQEMKTDIDVKPGTTIVLKFNTDAMGEKPEATEPSTSPSS